jgi:hypothetical protein
VSKNEFETLGFLFNFTPNAIRRIYKEFDISGKAELGYDDFELFVLAAIELQQSMDETSKKTGPLKESFITRVKNRISSMVAEDPAPPS